MKKGLMNHLSWLANSLSECYVYREDWSPEFIKKEMNEKFDTFYKSLKRDSNKNLIDFENLTVEEASELRFGRWMSDEDIDEDIAGLRRDLANGKLSKSSAEKKIKNLENMRNLWLIPLWLYPLIPDGMKLTDIFGEDMVFDEKLDNDTRFGCVAYSIHIKE